MRCGHPEIGTGLLQSERDAAIMNGLTCCTPSDKTYGEPDLPLGQANNGGIFYALGSEQPCFHEDVPELDEQFLGSANGDFVGRHCLGKSAAWPVIAVKRPAEHRP